MVKSPTPEAQVKGSGSKPGRSTKVLIVVFAAFLVISSLLLALYILIKNDGLEMLGSIIYKKNINFESLESQIPWDKEVASGYTPTTEELSLTYKELREGCFQRDYDKYTENLAYRNKWLLDKNPTFAGYTKDSYPVSEIQYPNGREYFEKYAPAWCVDPISHIVSTYFAAVSVTEGEKYDAEENSHELAVVDPETDEVTRIKHASYDNLAALCYQVEGSLPQQYERINQNEVCDLKVYFSYEDGKWKMLYNDLNVKFKEGATLGDIGSGGTVTTVSPGESDLVYEPKVVRIKQGDKVQWNDVSGVVFGLDYNWNSPRLNGESYEKQFTSKGEYEYIIAVSNSLEIFFEGKVIVE